jgi:sec-independent protein translocase protein TatB
MLEVGWSEILVIALILIIVVGPKDLPPMLRTFGRMAARLRGMANEFKGQFDEALREADLEDVRKGLSEVNKLNPTSTLRDAMNPLRKLGEDLKSDLRKATDIAPPTATEGLVEDANAPDIVPVEPMAAPETSPVAPAAAMPVTQKIAEPVPAVQPSSPDVAATPVAKAKASRKNPTAKDIVSDTTLVAAPEEPVAKKSSPRKKAVAEDLVADPAAVAKPRKPAARKKTDKAGDA